MWLFHGLFLLISRGELITHYSLLITPTCPENGEMYPPPAPPEEGRGLFAETCQFAGKDLELIADAEGITGFITQVTVRVQENFEPSVVAAAFPNPHAVAAAMQDRLVPKGTMG
jgi:hypothetical protein